MKICFFMNTIIELTDTQIRIVYYQIQKKYVTLLGVSHSFNVKYKAWITNDYIFFVSDTIKFDIIITCPSSICCCWNEKRLFSCCKSYYFHLQLCTPYKFMTVQGLQHKVPPTGYCSNSVSITRRILGPCHLYIVFIYSM